MSDYPMLISNKLHSFRNFQVQDYDVIELCKEVCYMARVQNEQTGIKILRLYRKRPSYGMISTCYYYSISVETTS